MRSSSSPQRSSSSPARTWKSDDRRSLHALGLGDPPRSRRRLEELPGLWERTRTATERELIPLGKTQVLFPLLCRQDGRRRGENASEVERSSGDGALLGEGRQNRRLLGVDCEYARFWRLWPVPYWQAPGLRASRGLRTRDWSHSGRPRYRSPLPESPVRQPGPSGASHRAGEHLARRGALGASSPINPLPEGPSLPRA